MRIEIAQRLTPFCHKVGTFCLIPGTDWKVQIFPTRWVFQKIEENESFSIDFDLEGPFKDFTFVQDLEKGKVTVFGFAKHIYFKMDIQGHANGIDVIFIKGSSQGVQYRIDRQAKKMIYPKDRVTIDLNMTKLMAFSSEFERLCLGSHKKQDWELMLRRQDLKEIIPIWVKLGSSQDASDYPVFHPLLEKCKQCLQNKDKVGIERAFLNFFQASFEGIMCPTLEDRSHLGLMKTTTFFFSPLLLLQKGAQLLRSMFFEQKDHHLYILPCLGRSFVSGRFTQIYLEEIGVLHFQWSKKLIRKMILQASSNTQIYLHLQKQIKTFRLRTKRNEKGSIIESTNPLQLKAGSTYFLDRFEK